MSNNTIDEKTAIINSMRLLLWGLIEGIKSACAIIEPVVSTHANAAAAVRYLLAAATEASERLHELTYKPPAAPKPTVAVKPEVTGPQVGQ